MYRWVSGLIVSLLLVPTAFSQGTAFTYQGQLNANGSPANGVFDMSFSLFTGSAGGSATATITNAGIVVYNGLFTTTLDFSNQFNSGQTYWLEIAVTSGPYTILSPRQQILATPYAVTAANLSGMVPVAQIPSLPANKIQGMIPQNAGGTGATNATQSSENNGGVYPLPVDQVTSTAGLPPGSVIKQIGISPDNLLYIWDGSSWSNFYHLDIPGGLAGIGTASTMGLSAFFTYDVDWYFWGSPATQVQEGFTRSDGGINIHGMNPFTSGALISFSMPTTNAVGNGVAKSTNADGVPIYWKGQDKLAYSMGAVGEQAAMDDGPGFFYLGLSDNREFPMAIAVNTGVNGVQGNFPLTIFDTGNLATRYPMLTGAGNFPYLNAGEQDTMVVNGVSNTVTLGPGTQLKLGGATVSSGTGSPEGVIVGNVGDMYSRTDGGPGSTFYVKESGSGTANGWTAK